MRLSRLNLCRSLLLLLLLLPGYVTAQDKIRVVSLVLAQQAEKQAEDALAYAGKVVRMAEELGDTEALAVARDAEVSAASSLQRARQQRSKLQAIIQAHQPQHGSAATGRASSIQGDVYLRTEAGDLRIDAGFMLQPGDHIATGRESGIDIQLPDGSKIRLGPKSSFVAASLDGDVSFSRFIGHFKAVVKSLHRSRYRSFTVSSFNCVVAVRGTSFEVNTTDTMTTVTVQSGEVEVKPLNGDAVMVNAGWRYHVDRNGNGSLGGISFFQPALMSRAGVK